MTTISFIPRSDRSKIEKSFFVVAFSSLVSREKKIMSITEEEREGKGSNEPTREQCLLDATGCLYKLTAEKACHRWSFMLEGNRTGKSYHLTVNHGLHNVAKKFGTQKFTVEISIHHCKKEPQFPNGKSDRA